MDVGKRIQYLRQQRQITVNRLATLSGVSQSYLRDIELGKKQPTVEYLEYICGGLSVSLAEFFDVEEAEGEIGKTLEDSVKHLTERQKALLIQFLESL